MIWLIFKHFPTRNSASSAAYRIQNYRNRKPKANFLKLQFIRETAYGLIQTWSYLKKQEEYELDFGIKLKKVRP